MDTGSFLGIFESKITNSLVKKQIVLNMAYKLHRKSVSLV